LVKKHRRQRHNLLLLNLIEKGEEMIEPLTDIVPSFFAMLNQGPLTLTIFLHTLIILPMFWIYKQEKKKLEEQ
jgi:hypothetical protein